MELIGDIRPRRPLVVAALRSEVQYLERDWPILITGVGKVAAATAVRGALCEVRPSVLVNVGTAGALVDGLSGTFAVLQVLQHDLDSEAIRRLTGQGCGLPIDLATLPGEAEVVSCATGDVFVADSGMRSRLAQQAQVCDMEGYAVAYAARSLDIPVIMLKCVSDPADETARASWVDSVDRTAKSIAEALEERRERLAAWHGSDSSAD
ncbi:nucleosidase [Enemella sp. A6]|uniref:nucleosidase n=1 Tax=Enemella sp. A6 TaxID=3440152 RepID=UPI003EBA1CC7